jgi:uncharacterized protein (DUF849 family)
MTLKAFWKSLMENKKFILNFSPTGMIPTKAMTPHVPVTPKK